MTMKKAKKKLMKFRKKLKELSKRQ